MIIDTDNQGNAAVTFGQNPDEYEQALYDVLVDGESAEEDNKKIKRRTVG